MEKVAKLKWTISMIILLLFSGSVTNCSANSHQLLKVAVIDGAYVNSKYVSEHENLTKPSHAAALHAYEVERLITRGVKRNKVRFEEIGVFNNQLSVKRTNFREAIRACIHKKCKIINFSGGFSCNDPISEMLIAKFVRNGGIFIASAGNTFGGKSDFPANQPGVVSVGGLFGKKVAYYSAKEKVDRWRNGDYGNDFGTSYAAPRYTNNVIKQSINFPKMSVGKLIQITK